MGGKRDDILLHTSSFCLGVRAVRKPEVLALSALPPTHEALHSVYQSHRGWATQHEVGTVQSRLFLLLSLAHSFFSFLFLLLSLAHLFFSFFFSYCLFLVCSFPFFSFIVSCSFVLFLCFSLFSFLLLLWHQLFRLFACSPAFLHLLLLSYTLNPLFSSSRALFFPCPRFLLLANSRAR